MHNDNSVNFFHLGRGELGKLIREKDWNTTALGNPNNWPSSLRTMTNVLLENPFAMCIAWGDDYIQIYNDAFRHILGTHKHPKALGISARKTFSEIWNILEPQFEDVMKGQAVSDLDYKVHLNRQGYPEECYFDFSLSPIRLDDGRVGGILATVVETTAKKEKLKYINKSAERFRYLAESTDILISISDENNVAKYYNNAWTNLTGRSTQELLEKGWVDLIHPLDTEGYAIFHNNQFDSQIELRVLNAAQQYSWLLLKKLPHIASDQTFAGHILVSIDLTEQKIIEEDKQKLTTIIEASPEVIGLADLDYSMQYCNPTALKMLGWDTIAGKKIIDCIFPEDRPFANKVLPALVEEGHFQHEIRFWNEKTGVPFWIQWNGITIKNPLSDEVVGLATVSLNINKRKNTEERIRVSENNLKLMIHQAPVAIAIMRGTDYVVEIANAQALELWGRKEVEVLNKPVFEAMPELLSQGIKELVEDVYQTGKRFVATELPVQLLRSGEMQTIYINFSYEPLYNTEGNINGIMAIGFDVTQQAITRQKIKASEQRFQAAVKAVKGILWTNNAKGEMEGDQQGWSDLTGQSIDEYQGYGWSSKVHPDDAQPTVDAWNEAVKESKTFNFEHRVKVKDGSWRLFSIKAIPIINDDGSVREWVGVHTDITDAKESEKNLKENKEKLSIVIEASELGIWELDLLTREITYSDRFLEIIGYTERIKLTDYDTRHLIHPEDIEMRNHAFDNAIQTGVLHYVGRIIRPDNKLAWIESKGKVFYNNKNEAIQIIGTIIDITADKNQQQILKESEQKFRLLADSMPQHIWTADPEGHLNYFNQSVINYSGLTLEQIDEYGWLYIVHPDDKAENIQKWMHSITTGEDFLFEHRFRRYDGEYRWQLSRAIPQKDEKGNIQMWVGTSTDIQDQKTFAYELEKQVRDRTIELEHKNLELKKMNKELESFAYISSHDLQEPLRKIQTFSSQIVEKEAQNLSTNAQDKFQRMQKAAQRMQTLIDDLLSYSRTSTAERKFEVTDLGQIVTEVKEDLKEELHQKQATVEIDHMCKISIIPFQFRQLMYNLISNSLKFSRPHVAPVIKVSSSTVNGHLLNNEKLDTLQDYCHIRISDNGIGFDSQYSDRIFEVFQRLHGKAEYDGTGIGLSIVKKIVENHNGIIQAKGYINEGATFDIYIPLNLNSYS